MPRHDVDDVDPYFVRLPQEAGDQQFGGGRYPVQAMAVERMVGGLDCGARLHFDEGEHLAAPGNQVDLADRSPDALAKDAPALGAQEPGRGRFGPAAPAFRLGAGLLQEPSSSARS